MAHKSYIWYILRKKLLITVCCIYFNGMEKTRKIDKTIVGIFFDIILIILLLLSQHTKPSSFDVVNAN